MSAVTRPSITIAFIPALFQIVWFGVCVGQPSGCVLAKVHVCVEVYIAAKVIPNPERDLLAEVHRSAVLVGVRAVRIGAGVSSRVMKGKMRTWGVIHVFLNEDVFFYREINEH